MKPVTVLISSLAIIVALIITTVFGVQSSQNKAIAKELLIESSLSDLNAEYNRRAGLLVNLAEAVMSYNKHEAEVLVQLSQVRTPAEGNGNVNASAYIRGVVERYPELRSIENYKQYMNELSMTENRIASHRKYYNKNVTEYHQHVRMFPSNICLSILGYQEKDYKVLEFANAPVDALTGLLKEKN